MIIKEFKYNIDIEVKKDYACMSVNPSGLIYKYTGNIDYNEYTKYFIPILDFAGYSGILMFHIDELTLSVTKDDKVIYSNMLRYYKHAGIKDKPKYPLACKMDKDEEVYKMFSKLMMAEELIR